MSCHKQTLSAKVEVKANVEHYKTVLTANRGERAAHSNISRQKRGPTSYPKARVFAGIGLAEGRGLGYCGRLLQKAIAGHGSHKRQISPQLDKPRRYFLYFALGERFPERGKPR